MGIVFAPNPGELEITPWYADNEIFLQELKFSVPASEWSEFQSSQLFSEIKAFVSGIEKQIPNTHIGNHVPVRREGNVELIENSSQPDRSLSFLALIRKLFHRMR